MSYGPDARMDHVSSPADITTSPAVAGTPRAQPPTYTTAGTLYNPSSSQPLQPPARRGRSFKWTNGSIHSDLTLLPKSALAALPLKGAGNRAQVYQQYTPLQQNYDRAVSPSCNLEHHLFKMADQALQVRSGNTPAPISLLLAESREDKSSLDSDVISDDSDSDSDFGMDPLAGMTVKSLHNLASYPNPNQKRAQRALLQGVKPTMTGWGAPGRSHTSASSSGTRPVGSPIKGSLQYKDVPRPAQPDTAAIRRIATFGRQKVNPFRVEGDCIESRNATSLGPFGHIASHKILGSGSGGPRPLTAGPPGQRQYRPSTFESTFKALQVKSQDDHGEDENENHIGISIVDGEPAAVLPSYHHYSECTSRPLRTDPMCRVTQPGAVSSKNWKVNGDDKGRLDLIMAQRFVPDFLSMTRASPSQETLQSGCHGHQRLSSTPWWNEFNHDIRSRFKPGTDILTDEEINARNAKIEDIWYAGSDLIGKTTSEAILDAKYRELERNLGVIGDKRQTSGRVQYKTIEIDEANRMSAAEHAHPLINMAFATLLRCIGEGYDEIHSELTSTTI
jgi:hypothetical protein